MAKRELVWGLYWYRWDGQAPRGWLLPSDGPGRVYGLAPKTRMRFASAEDALNHRNELGVIPAICPRPFYVKQVTVIKKTMSISSTGGLCGFNDIAALLRPHQGRRATITIKIHKA